MSDPRERVEREPRADEKPEVVRGADEAADNGRQSCQLRPDTQQRAKQARREHEQRKTDEQSPCCQREVSASRRAIVEKFVVAHEPIVSASRDPRLRQWLRLRLRLR